MLDDTVPGSDEELEQIQSVIKINLPDKSSDEWSESKEDFQLHYFCCVYCIECVARQIKFSLRLIK